jgi:hypothetical protein
MRQRQRRESSGVQNLQNYKETSVMAKPGDTKSIDEALAHVDESRRGFLKGLLLGSAALAALPLMNSNALAQDGGATPDDGKGKGKKGKGKKGKGDGGDDSGKGKGDN